MEHCHVLKFVNSGAMPEFIVRQIGNFESIKTIKFDGIVSFKVMPGRFCIGNLMKNNSHKYCFNKVSSGYQCNDCFKQNPYNFCAFCSGTRCYLGKKICGEHFVYLATFANVLKVGVTSIRRWPERVIEQGADFASVISQTPDGLEARRIESEIKKRFNITDKMYNKYKSHLLHRKDARELGKHILQTAYADIVDAIPATTKLDLDILDLSENYTDIEEQPNVKEITDDMQVCGKIIGTKGNFIVMKSGAKTEVFNGYDLVGRVIKME
ncbi:MAG: DUF2797 domain-containing protein [Candidatus Nanoarchaeia archaeon]|nr:DUF2797 domain-containing protein [Candidatus Nanoarchaeia archaeon]MDD5239759.1 DUF2797 domain-containing protein [Candidatus Nanoarchaeia archaeon]